MGRVEFPNQQLEEMSHTLEGDGLLRTLALKTFGHQVQRAIRTDIIMGTVSVQTMLELIGRQVPSIHLVATDGANGNVTVGGRPMGTFYLFYVPVKDGSLSGIAFFVTLPDPFITGDRSLIESAIEGFKSVYAPLDHKEAGSSLAYAGGPSTGFWIEEGFVEPVVFAIPEPAAKYRLP